MRVGVFGLGRSGIAVARAALMQGAQPVVFDEKHEDQLRHAVDNARSNGIEVRAGWTGGFEGENLDLLITSPGVPMRHPKLQAALAAGIEVVSEVEWAYRISKAPIIAITGTNGKSTTTVMTWLCLRSAGQDAVLCGNIYGSGYDEVPLTEAALHATSEQVLVAEVSSFQLEWVREFAPVVAGITNITPDHLDRYESFDEYASVKQRIFARQGGDHFIVMRAGDPVVAPPSGPTIYTFGPSGEHARVTESALVLFGQEIAWSDLPIHQPHDRSNASMACLMAYSFLRWRAAHDSGSVAARLVRSPAPSAAGNTATAHRIVPHEVVDGLREFRGLAHRMERVGEKKGVLVINNSMCTNPAAVVSSAKGVQRPKHLLIGGSNKKLDFAPLRDYLAESGDRAYLYGRDAQQVSEQMGGSHPVFATLREAFDEATRNAKPGDVIMLAPGCASQDQFEDFRDRGNVFREIAKEWLNS